ncbi:MAG: DUF2237 domain-containing protein [Parvularculaceae bacterium]|nr:DUF2237 domain-containing protein [Parvularculaceae bacterium]
MAFRESGGGGGGDSQKNVLGGALETCSVNPMTGFFRTGCCHTAPQDTGAHTVCAVMTDDFLAFSKSRGNDLSTPHPAFGFPGLKAGDRWCLCAARWKEAFDAGKAPKLVLAATHERTLHYAPLEALKEHAADLT